MLARQGRQLGDRHAAREALDAEVARVDLEQAPGVGADRVGVVAQVRAVRRADLAEPRAGRGDEVRQPEAGADLDELAAADDDLPPGGESGRREDEGCRAVVDDEGRLRGRARGEQGRPGTGTPGGALTGREVELDVDIARRGDERLDGGRRERRAAEVGVDDDTGGVEHRSQARRRMQREHLLEGGRHLLRRDLAGARPVLRRVDGRADEGLAETRSGRLDGGPGEEEVGPGDGAARVGHRLLLGRVAGGWRRRTGIEPAGPRCSVPPVLKTGEPTRCPDASGSTLSGGPVRDGPWSLRPPILRGRHSGPTDDQWSRRSPGAVLSRRRG